MAEASRQIGLDLRPPKPARPRRAAGERPVDEALRTALALLLHVRHFGRENAATWEALRDELVAEGMPRVVIRRLQEAAELLLEEEGAPIVGLSSDGVWWAASADEIEQALRECEKRARKTLRRRRLLRTAWKELLGQERMREGQAA